MDCHIWTRTIALTVLFRGTAHTMQSYRAHGNNTHSCKSRMSSLLTSILYSTYWTSNKYMAIKYKRKIRKPNVPNLLRNNLEIPFRKPILRNPFLPSRVQILPNFLTVAEKSRRSPSFPQIPVTNQPRNFAELCFSSELKTHMSTL